MSHCNRPGCKGSGLAITAGLGSICQEWPADSIQGAEESLQPGSISKSQNQARVGDQRSEAVTRLESEGKSQARDGDWQSEDKARSGVTVVAQTTSWAAL